MDQGWNSLRVATRTLGNRMFQADQAAGQAGWSAHQGRVDRERSMEFLDWARADGARKV